MSIVLSLRSEGGESLWLWRLARAGSAASMYLFMYVHVMYFIIRDQAACSKLAYPLPSAAFQLAPIILPLTPGTSSVVTHHSTRRLLLVIVIMPLSMLLFICLPGCGG